MEVIRHSGMYFRAAVVRHGVASHCDRYPDFPDHDVDG